MHAKPWHIGMFWRFLAAMFLSSCVGTALFIGVMSTYGEWHTRRTLASNELQQKMDAQFAAVLPMLRQAAATPGLCETVLRMLAQVLREETREGDVAARYGGEEFIVALPHTSAASALIVAERIRERVACERVAIAGATVGITVSLGIAQCGPGQGDVQEIIRLADLALYEAKHAGRNRVVTHAQHTAAEPG